MPVNTSQDDNYVGPTYHEKAVHHWVHGQFGNTLTQEEWDKIFKPKETRDPRAKAGGK
jgi:hypothetical protein